MPPKNTITPAWTAAKFAYTVGHHGLLGMIALGQLVYKAEDTGIVDQVYDRIAHSWMPGTEYANAWEDVYAQWPFLREPTAPLVKWVHLADPSATMSLTDIAAAFYLVDWPATYKSDQALGDFLGCVHMEMRRMDTGHLRKRQVKAATAEELLTWREPQVFTPYWMAAREAIAKGDVVTEDGSFTDLWCGSGTRMMGQAMAMRGRGRDPKKARWVGMSLDPLHIAMTAANVMAYEMVRPDGSNLRLEVSDAHAPLWILQHPHEAHERMLKGQVPEDLVPDSLMRKAHLMAAEDYRENRREVLAILAGSASDPSDPSDPSPPKPKRRRRR